MEFEEIKDMAVSAVNKAGLGISNSSMKLIRMINACPEEEIVNSMIILMFLAEQCKLNLEDNLLNKIENILKK